MGNCSKPQQAKKRVKEQVVVIKEHFHYRQLQVLNRLNPTQIARLLEHFTRVKNGQGVRLQKLQTLYPGLSTMSEAYVRNLFGMLDLTNDGVICFTDFCVGVARVSLAGEDERIRFLYDFINLRATADLSLEQLTSAIQSSVLVPKPSFEATVASLPPQLPFANFKTLAIQHLDFNASLSFSSFLPTAKQQRAEVQELLSRECRPTLGSKWYVVAANWVQTWERYVQYPLSLTKGRPVSDPLEDDDILTAIDNTGLCSEEEPLILACNGDQFIEVPSAVWQYWVQLYGGGPALPRDTYQNGDTVEVDLYPCLFRCYEVAEAVYDVKQVKKILISIQKRGESVKTALGEALERKEQTFEVYIRQTKKWVKITEEQKLDALKTKAKCLIVSNSSPLAQWPTLKEVKSPAVSSEQQSFRILSQWMSEGAEPPHTTVLELPPPKTVLLPWKGVPNLGNTCYLNSVLQGLCYTPLFGHFFLNKGFALGLNTSGTRSLSQCIAELFNNMTSVVKGLPNASKVHWMLGQQIDLFQGHDENDAHECLLTLLDRLHEELKRANSTLVLATNLSSPSHAQLKTEIGKIWKELHGDFGSPVSDLFAGIARTNVTCSSCEHRTVTLTPAFSLDLQMPQQTTLEVLVRVFPLEGPSVQVGIIAPVTETVETLLKQAKALVDRDMKDVVLFSWAYSGVYSVYSQETKLQEVIHDGSVNLYAMELDSKGQPSEEAAPIPGETPRVSENNHLLKVVHRYNITKDGFQTKDYLPEVYNVPERLTKAELLDIIAEKSRRFRSDSVPAESVRHSAYFVDFSSKFCGLCANVDCLGCGITPGPDTVVWTQLKEKTVVWVRWEVADSFQLTEEKHASVNEVQERRAKGISITDCLDAYSKSEPLAAKCEFCKADLMSNIEMVKMPDVLVVTFCRFKLTDSLPIKVSCLVKFPLHNFNMGKWVSSSEAEAGSCTALKTPLQYIYDLYAVVEHIGTARSGICQSGHYRAYCNVQEDRWVRFDDSQATEVQGSLEGVLVSSSAYILFYRKKIMQSKNLVQYFT